MLKNLLRIPDTFDPDDRRRRQVMNVLLLICIFGGLAGGLISLILLLSAAMGAVFIQVLIFMIILFVALLFMNRSARVPAWIVGTVFITIFIVLSTQMDTPHELYNGRSTIIFVVPIMISAIIFPPGYAFLVTLVVCVLMQLFTPPDPRYLENSVNYYSMVVLFMITFSSWLGMSIANRAIRDARGHAARLEAILNNIADGVLVFDLQGSFISANPALLRMIPEERLRQMNDKSLEDTLRWEQKIFSVRVSSVPDVGTVAVFRDETRRRETEQAKDALLATVSHELRTPLAVMMNYIELIQALVGVGKINSDEFNEHLARALENCQRLHRLVNNIMDQAQIQAGTLELKRQRFNLSALLEKTRQFVATLLDEKHLSFKLNITPNVPTEINGDPERLRQALVNLLGNAAKFTSQGEVRVNVSRPNEETLSIEVVDTGPGIPAEQLPDIFETFRRGSNYVRREQQGAGLGLSITKEIVTRMGGQISVASRPGAGSTFTVSLPLGQAHAA